MFPINAAEQEKYYISNVLKKPQRINIHQFVCRVEQLNAYIAWMPCFYYSPNANASTKPENVPFTEVELGVHVLCMCPLQWQDQYNMNKKGMTPMDTRLLLTSLEAIRWVCTYKKGKIESSKKSSHKSKKGKKHPGTNVGYCSGYYEARSASGRASGKKYKAQIVIFCILLAVNRFLGFLGKQKAVEDFERPLRKTGKPLRKIRKPLKILRLVSPM